MNVYFFEPFLFRSLRFDILILEFIAFIYVMEQRMGSSINSRLIKASAQEIYKAFTTPSALTTWQAPGDMTARIHNFDLRVGGGYEMSLFYPEEESFDGGKTEAKEDRFTARFVTLVPGKELIQAIRFHTDKAEFSGEMLMKVLLEPKESATLVTIRFENIPPGIKEEDNEAGTESSLAKLDDFVTGTRS